MKRSFFIPLIILTLVVGSIHVLPSLWVPLGMGGDYRGIFPFQSADEEYYGLQIKKSMEGYYRYRPGVPGEKGEGLPPFRATAVLGWLGGKTGLEIGQFLFLLRLLVPMLAFLLTFSLFRSLGIPDEGALFFSLFCILAPYGIYGWLDPLARPVNHVLTERSFRLLWYEQYSIASLPWTRVGNSQFSGIFFLAGLLCLVKLIRARNRWLWLVLTAIVLVLNLKLYFFFWSTLVAVLFVSFLMCLYFNHKKALVPFGILTAAGFAALIPLVFVLGKSLGSSRANFLYSSSHSPIFSPGCGVALLLLFPGLFFRKSFRKNPENGVLFLSFPLAYLLTMNQNVFTGRLAQPWHYELFTGPILLSLSLSVPLFRLGWGGKILSFIEGRFRSRNTLPFLCSGLAMFATGAVGGVLFLYYFKLAPQLEDALVFIAAAAFEAVLIGLFLQILILSLVFQGENRLRPGKLAVWGLCLLVLAEGVSRQAYLSARNTRQAVEIQELAPAFSWLDEKTPEGSVVLSSFETANRIPFFTHNRVYLTKGHCHNYPGTEKERWEHALDYFVLTGHDEDQFRSRLSEWPYGYLFWGLLGLTEKKDLYSFGRQDPVSQETIKILLVMFREKGENSLTSIVKEHPFQYIFFGRNEREFFPRNPADFLPVRKIYQDDHNTIFEIIPE